MRARICASDCGHQLPELIRHVLSSKAQRGHIPHGLAGPPFHWFSAATSTHGEATTPRRCSSARRARATAGHGRDLRACERRWKRPPTRPASAGGRPPTASRVPARTTGRPRAAFAMSPTTALRLPGGTRRRRRRPYRPTETRSALGHSAVNHWCQCSSSGLLMPVRGLCPRDVVVELPTHARRHPSSSLEAGLTVLAHRFELPEAHAERSSVGGEQRLVDQ